MLTSSDVLALQPPGDRGAPRIWARRLALLSLEAFAGVGHITRVPIAFGESQRHSLQCSLARFVGARPWLEVDRDALVLFALNQYAEDWGGPRLHEIADWLGYGWFRGVFGEKLGRLLNARARGGMMTQAPARICRFQSSFRLFSDFDMDLVESLLSPDALVADWDTRVYNEQFDSSENLNTWDPAAAAIGYGINTAARLAWENACTDSPPGPQELRSIQHWLADELSVPVKELPSPDDLLLPPHLRRDYQNRGWIARSD